MGGTAYTHGCTAARLHGCTSVHVSQPVCTGRGAFVDGAPGGSKGYPPCGAAPYLRTLACTSWWLLARAHGSARGDMGQLTRFWCYHGASVSSEYVHAGKAELRFLHGVRGASALRKLDRGVSPHADRCSPRLVRVCSVRAVKRPHRVAPLPAMQLCHVGLAGLCLQVRDLQARPARLVSHRPGAKAVTYGSSLRAAS